MTELAWETIAGYVYDVGLRGETAAIAVAITGPESGRDPSKHNSNAATGDDSWGLWQINMIGDLGPARRARYGIGSNSALTDPAVNAKAMYLESGGGSNFGGPWRNTYGKGLHAPFLPDARAAVKAVEARGGIPTTSTTTADDGTSTDATTTVVPFHTEDISWGLPAAIDPTVHVPLSANWGPGFFVRGQSALRTLLAGALTGGQLDVGVDDIAEMTLEVAAPSTWAVQAVADELTIGSTVDWWDLLLRIVGVEWSEGDGQTYSFTVSCRAAGPEDMRDLSTLNAAREFADMSATEVLATLADENGLRFVGQGSNRRDLIVRKGPTDTAPTTKLESSWDLAQRLAKEEGYWCFESAGTLYFARPSWLAARMPRFDVKPRTGGLRGVDDPGGGNSGTVGVPNARQAVADDLLPGLPPRTITVKLPRDRGEQVRPGMVADFTGLPYFDGPYLVSRVSFPFDGGLEPAIVELVDITDPVPEPDPTTTFADGTNAATAAGVGSSATPVGTTGHSALDMVTIALRQVGDRYVYGAETSPDDPDPTAFDCSELIQWACARVGVDFPDGSENQMAAVRAAGLPNPPHGLAVADCKNIRGAFLWHPGHCAISLGDGAHTVEAMGRQYGVVQGNIGARFLGGGLIPGLDYGVDGQADPEINPLSKVPQ